MKKERLSLVVMLIMLLAMSVSLLADGTQPPGSGTAADPYQVSTLDHLLWISTNSGSWGLYFEQTADIDASSTSTWNGGAGFLPIGNTSRFTGSYNGQGHTIDSLFINRPTTDYIGLFGYITRSNIDSVGLTNVNITGDQYVGGLVGVKTIHSTVSNCYSTGSVSGDQYVGGLVGNSYYRSAVKNCYSTGSVSGNSDVGGLMGYNYYISAIDNCYSTGSVSGTGSYVGGLVGNNYYNSTVSNCYSTGSVSGTGYIGGLIGDNNYSTVSNSFWNTETSGQSSSAGGTGKTTAEMKNVRTFTDVAWSSGLLFAWDFVGNPYDDTGTNDYWDIDGTTNDGYPYLSWQPPASGYIYLQVEYRDGTPCNFPTELDTAWAINHNAKADTVKWGDPEMTAYNDTIQIAYEILGWGDGDSIDITVRATPSGDTIAQSNTYGNSISGGGNQYWTSSDSGGLTLPVVLSSFTAQFVDNKPTLNWTTESECNNLGWYIYRGETDEFNKAEQINKEIIPGAGTTSLSTEYEFADETGVINGKTYWYWLESISYDSHAEQYGPIKLTIPEDGGSNESPTVPEKYGLFQNYPNPFNPNTLIYFKLKEDSKVQVSIYNVRGELVNELYRGLVDGETLNRLSWDGRDESGEEVSSGIYFYKLKYNGGEYSKKMLLLK